MYKRESKKKNTWYLNTQSKQSHKSMFVELDESKCDHVTFRDTSKILVKGEGKILIHLKMEVINSS